MRAGCIHCRCFQYLLTIVKVQIQSSETEGEQKQTSTINMNKTPEANGREMMKTSTSFTRQLFSLSIAKVELFVMKVRQHSLTEANTIHFHNSVSHSRPRTRRLTLAAMEKLRVFFIWKLCFEVPPTVCALLFLLIELQTP